jgi:glycosyltransferase involved in cell wall biosynthesis
VEALGQLREVTGWACWLAGGVQRPSEQVYQDELRRRVSELGIGDRVQFLGQRTDVPRLLAAADIHCQPNTGPEPFGITFVEAMQSGLPVVTSPIGGAFEVVDESCGVFVPPGDVAGLAAALRRLIDNPAERSRLGSAGPGRAKQLADPSGRMARIHALLLGAGRNVPA